MCVSFGGGGGRKPASPLPITPAPPLKPSPPPQEIPTPEEIDKNIGEEEIVKGKKKTKLRIDKLKAGVKEFGAITGDVPTAPTQGITPPTGGP